MEALLNGCSLVFLLQKPFSSTGLKVIVGLQYLPVLYVFSLITSIILPSSAIYFHILFCNALAVPKDLFSSNNNCGSNNIKHAGATCMHPVTFFAFLITALDGIKWGVLTFFFYLSKQNCQGISAVPKHVATQVIQRVTNGYCQPVYKSSRGLTGFFTVVMLNPKSLV